MSVVTIKLVVFGSSNLFPASAEWPPVAAAPLVASYIKSKRTDVTSVGLVSVVGGMGDFSSSDGFIVY